MALVDTVWYLNAGDQATTGYYAITKRPQNTAVAAGVLRRQFTAPAVGSERVFVCIIAGTTANVTDATWVLTRGAKTVDGTATWMECTGQASLNGDLTNTTTWAQVKAATPAVLGQIIKRSNNASYQICTTAGAMSASEPTFSDTAGVTTADTTAVWTSLGVVGNFTGGQAPFARLDSACGTNWFANNCTIYLADNHAESQATAISIAPATSGSTSVNKFICHNHSGPYPPTASDLRTGASISTTAAVNLTFNPSAGTFYFYGVTFQSGVGAATSGFLVFTPTNALYIFENCLLKVASTYNAAILQACTIAGGSILWNNCTVSFGNVAQYVETNSGMFVWQNTGPVLAAGSSVPTSLFGQGSNGRTYNVTLEALDLSQITGNIANASFVSTGNILVKDCKLNATTTTAAATFGGPTVQLVRSSA